MIDRSQLNFAQGNNFSPFIINKIPDIDLTIQSVQLPEISIETHEIPNAYSSLIEIPGNIDFSDLEIGFIVDEQFENYSKILTWMFDLGYGEQRTPTLSDEVSDGSFSILNNNFNPILTAEFSQCFPISLSGIDFASNSEEMNLTATLTMKFTSFSLS